MSLLTVTNFDAARLPGPVEFHASDDLPWRTDPRRDASRTAICLEERRCHRIRTWTGVGQLHQARDRPAWRYRRSGCQRHRPRKWPIVANTIDLREFPSAFPDKCGGLPYIGFKETRVPPDHLFVIGDNPQKASIAGSNNLDLSPQYKFSGDQC